MTTHKTFKRRVRARSARTGESYTAARAQLLRHGNDAAPTSTSKELTGVSDDAMRAGSGRTIGEWLPILDAWGARERTHREIARWLVSEQGIGGWWAQSVTVGYERARGMRALYQRPSGFEVSASRTVGVSAERVSDALTDPALLAAWMPEQLLSLRTARRGRSARFDWGDPPSLVVFGLTVKGEAKTQVAVAHQKLPEADTAQRLQRMWRERLTALKELLEGA